MAVFRLILLVAVLGALTLLLVQNWSPVLPLVFLGMHTHPLPLALWILFSTAAGASTSLLITICLQLSNYFAEPQRRTPLKSSASDSRGANRMRQEEAKPQKEAPPSTARQVESRTTEALDDWDTDTSTNDDWDFDEKSTASQQKTQVRDSSTYERQQEQTTSSKSGSVYSYSYQEPKNSGVGKTESIYDADYRVIVPPYQPSTEAKDAEDDDWGFFDDDDVEDKSKRSR